ncbi:MAG: type II toxin-antitoxin system RelE/ParE family toxin [Elusimicrobia bacterium]|nr:type II toxin-antitoxin system RelE/ParE family toxin [Elusimicrobiota bacterium]
MTWKIELTPTARQMLLGVLDRRIREKIAQRIDALAHDPEKQGKPLTGELSGLYSLRAAGQRYRIIYRLEKNRIVVLIVAVGLRREGDRRDIYALAKKLIHLGLTNP